jgi:hypothetical protein
MPAIIQQANKGSVSPDKVTIISIGENTVKSAASDAFGTKSFFAVL